MYEDFIFQIKEMFKDGILEDCYEIQMGRIVYCHTTSRSKKPKPIEGNLYILRKNLLTKWGTKSILVGIDGQEVWGDIHNIACIPTNIHDKIPTEIFETLSASLSERIIDDCTPAIGDVLKKNYAGIEIKLTTGQKIFISKKLIYPESIYEQARTGETISINIPIWFAIKNNIINENSG